MNATHTPGPWTVAHYGGPESREQFISVKRGPWTIARIANLNGANAALIAAAPEMYAALHHLMKAEPMQQGERNGYIMGIVSQAIDKARTAIAKAEGK